MPASVTPARIRPGYAGQWLAEMLADGTLAATAWSGYLHLPRHGS